MRGIGMVVGMVAICLLGATSDPGEDRSQQESIDEFIDRAPPIDLTDRFRVERATYRSMPRKIVDDSLGPLAHVQYLAEQHDCPRVIDRSDPDAGITDLEYLGDGCRIEDESLTLFGRVRVIEDGMFRRIEYHDWTQQEQTSPDVCEGAEFDRQRSWLGTVILPVGEGARDADAAGHYDVLMKYTSRWYTAECALEERGWAHDYEFEIDVMDDGTKEQKLVNQYGRSAIVDPRDPPEEEPHVSYQAAREDLALERHVCTSEPISGRILLNAGANTVAIEPNGATDCDGDYCAPWILNGEVQPEEVCDLNDTGCQASAHGYGGMGALMLIGLSLLFMGRRSGARKRRGGRGA